MPIAHIGVSKGGLGLLYAGLRAAPDFVLTMTAAARYAAPSFRLNAEVEPIRLHPTISNLYSLESNPGLVYLQRYQLLTPHIADIACWNM